MKWAKGTFKSRYLKDEGPLEVHKGDFRVLATSESGAYGSSRVWKRVKK